MSQPFHSGRLLSLDAFRGLTIAGMILVNTPGSWSFVYPPLRHAQWHGCTPTDLVFPFFLFIVGMSMFFSFARYHYLLTRVTAKKLLVRALMIFLTGMLLNAFPFYPFDVGHFRIMGVLQRIGLAFLLGGGIVLLTRGRYLIGWIALGILLGYWLLLYFLGDYSLEGNVVRQADLAILGENHLYRGFGIPFDPEGLLSTLPAVATVLMGFLAGKFLRQDNRNRQFLAWMLLAGLILIILGLIWNLFLPINKPLWTSSYVLFSAGMALMVFVLFYLVADWLHGHKWIGFFVVFGRNPLFIFALSILWVKILIRWIKIDSGGETVNGYTWLYTEGFVPWLGPLNGSLAFALAHVGMFWALAWILNRNGIYLKW